MKFFTIVLLLLTGCPLFGFCQLDTTFLHTGKIMDRRGMTEDIAVDSEGKILIVGGGGYENRNHKIPKIVRLNSDGTLDDTFGQGGGYFAGSGYTAPPFFTGVCLSPDGKLLFSGYTEVYWKPGWSSDDFSCLKVSREGKADLDFADSGIAITDIAHWWRGYWMEHGDDEPSDIALQPDGKIILYGNVNRGDALGWLRYLPNGKIDSTFGDYGIATSIVPNAYLQSTNDMAVMPDGRIVSAFMGTGSTNMGLIRLLPNGKPDSSFNQTGISGYYGGSWLTYCRALCLQLDGKVLLAGFSDSGIVVRFNLSGTRDSTFGRNGVVRLTCSELGDIALAPDGKILAAGNGDSCFRIFRLLPNGQLDTSFGTGGMLRSRPDSTGHNRAYSIALQPDGRILVGGHSEGSNWNVNPPQVWDNFVLVRYLPDGRPIGEKVETPGESLLSVYPNPAGTQISLKWLGCAQTGMSAKVYDMQGRIVLQKGGLALGSEPVLLDIAALASGTYFVQVAGSGDMEGECRFVKK